MQSSATTIASIARRGGIHRNAVEELSFQQGVVHEWTLGGVGRARTERRREVAVVTTSSGAASVPVVADEDICVLEALAVFVRSASRGGVAAESVHLSVPGGPFPQRAFNHYGSQHLLQDFIHLPPAPVFA